MIKEAKDFLTEIIKNNTDVETVVRSGKGEKKEISGRVFPFICLITNPGRFDERNKKEDYQYIDPQTKKRFKRTVRGKRIIPILIRVWGKTEEETDNIFSSIIPFIPSVWELDHLPGDIKIGDEEHSDHASSVSDRYLSILEIEMSAEVGTPPVEVPIITATENFPDY